MKKYLLLLATLFFGISNYASAKGDSPIYNATSFNVIVDFSTAQYNGEMTESGLATEYGEEWLNLWNSQKASLVNIYIEQINAILGKFTFATASTDNTSSDYDLIVQITNIDNDGEVDALVLVCQPGDRLKPVIKEKMNGDGGKSDSFVPLSTEGFCNLGEATGRFLRKIIRQRHYTDGFFKIYLHYDPNINLTYEYLDYYGEAHPGETELKGGGYGISRYFNVTGKHLPIFLEIGLRMNEYDFYDNSFADYFYAPMHLSYIFSFNRNKLLVAPYIGGMLQINDWASLMPSTGIDISYKFLTMSYHYQKTRVDDIPELWDYVHDYKYKFWYHSISFGFKF